ncbi:dTDP-glucose 4,6-dehydratase [Candidatus Kaiserbacteria bacterium]|nr:dTDP-glucose 4,6-dehydratase [Candidatus Kaiserbacteria bacterium]
MPSSASVLVTGGCGFMGSHFVRHLYHTYPHYRIINLDLLTYAGNPDNLRDVEIQEAALPPDKRRYVFVHGDICDETLLDKVFIKYPIAILAHFAAETHVDRSLSSVSDFIRTNVEGTRTLLEAARRYAVPHTVHISTDEVYGNMPEGFSYEDTLLNPSNPYSTSKAAGDMLARTYQKVYDLPVSVVRSGNNYGSHQYPEKLIPLTITNLLEGRPIPVHGTGEHVRSWVSVEDFSRAVDVIAHSSHAPDVYNIEGEYRTNLEIIALVARHLGKNHEHHLVFVNDRPNADLRYAPFGEKLRQKLGWKRRHSVDTAIGDVVDWYLANNEWWKALKAKKEYKEQYEKQSKAQWY